MVLRTKVGIDDEIWIALKLRRDYSIRELGRKVISTVAWEMLAHDAYGRLKLALAFVKTVRNTRVRHLLQQRSFASCGLDYLHRILETTLPFGRLI